MYFSVILKMNITEFWWFVKGFGWLLIGFVGAGRRNERWRKSHFSGKVLLLIIPWRLLLHGSDIISTWSNSYVLFRTKESLSFCMTQKASCYFKHSFVGIQGTVSVILMSPNSPWTPSNSCSACSPPLTTTLPPIVIQRCKGVLLGLTLLLDSDCLLRTP